ncbi:MAG: adenosylhomocysteinase [Synergistaceae bacterium]|nr:adenosylhomocysteinase [Synergistota bacterium]NLM71200.1 adenosylhomocysteinase [Synergistaceae bacterium]
MDYNISDIALAPAGERKIDWARRYMPVLDGLKRKYEDERPLEGLTISACLHLEAKTACLLILMKELGARVVAAGSNPLSTQDDVCAGLVKNGVSVFSRNGMTTEEYFANARAALAVGPDVVVDDGADLCALLHTEMKDLLPKVRGACEETTSGIKRLRSMAEQGVLAFPVISVNDAHSKYLFDNRYGTGQSVMDGLMRTTNMLVAGKTVVIAGYGWCGRGVAMRASAMGARVIVTEMDPHRAFEALMDGYEVTGMADAAPRGDIFLTLTGNTRVIRKEHFEAMKDGTLLGNAGHFDVEICKKDLANLATSVERPRPGIESYVMSDGRRLHLLGEGRLVNLACADGHPIEIMDLSFALQLESTIYMSRNRMNPGIHDVPREIDRSVVKMKLDSLGIKLDSMTDEQEEYMRSWEE